MTVKTSISLTDSQEAYARSLVESGQFPSLSAVLQRGLEMLREEKEAHEAELAALGALLKKRAKGPFISADEFKKRTDDMIGRKRAKLQR